jgi:hypothetical protein
VRVFGPEDVLESFHRENRAEAIQEDLYSSINIDWFLHMIDFGAVHVSSTKEEPKKGCSHSGIVAHLPEETNQLLGSNLLRR